MIPNGYRLATDTQRLGMPQVISTTLCIVVPVVQRETKLRDERREGISRVVDLFQKSAVRFCALQVTKVCSNAELNA